MKKLLFTFLLLIASFRSSAQVSLGLNGGFLKPLKKPESGLVKAEMGTRVGIETIFKLYMGISLRIGFDYARYTFQETFPARSVVSTPYTETRRVMYGSIPIGIRYAFGKRAFSPFAEGGISFQQKTAREGKWTRFSSYSFEGPPQICPFVLVGIKYTPVSPIYTSLQA